MLKDCLKRIACIRGFCISSLSTENFNPSVNNPTYEGISGFMAENPVFSEDTMEKAATPLSAGNPGFIDSGGAPPDYSSFMAKEKEAEVRRLPLALFKKYTSIWFMLYQCNRCTFAITIQD